MTRSMAAAAVAALLVTSGCGQSAENRLATARLAIGQGKSQVAHDHAMKVLDVDPEHAEALLIKARAQIMLGQFLGARDTGKKLVKAHPDDPEGRRLLMDWCMLYTGQLLGKSDFATKPVHLERFREALVIGAEQVSWMARQPDTSADALFNKARLAALEIGGIDRILAHAAAGVEAFETEEHVALKLRREKLRKQSEEHLEKAIEVRPDYFEAYTMYVNLHVMQGDWRGFWITCNRLAEQTGVPSKLADLMVVNLIRMPNDVQARPARLEAAALILQATADDQRESLDWLIGSSRVHLARQEYARAHELLERVHGIDPKHRHGRFLYARSLFGLEKFDEAKLILEKLNVEEGRSSHLLTLFGMTLARTGDTARAKEVLWKAKSLDPSNMLAQEQYFRLIQRDRLITEVGEDVMKFYRMNRQNPRAIRLMVQYLQSRGHRTELRRRLEKEVQMVSPLERAHLEILIDANEYLREYRVAERFARQLVNRDRDDLEANLRLADMLLHQGRDDQVSKLLESLRGRIDDDGAVDQMLGKLYLKRGALDQSVALLREVVDDAPDNHVARMLLARALARMALPEQALEQLDYVLAADPVAVAARGLAARICQLTDQEQRANEYAESINLESIDQYRFPLLAAQIMRATGDLAGAAEVCNRALAQGNSDPTLRVMLARIYKDDQKFEEAEHQLLQLIQERTHDARAYGLLTRFYAQRRLFKAGIERFGQIQIDADRTTQVLAQVSKAALFEASDQSETAIRVLDEMFGQLIETGHREVMAVADAMARVHLRSENTSAAVEVYQQLVDADFMRSRAVLRQVNVLSAAGDRDGALRRLDEISGTLGRSQRQLRMEVLGLLGGLGAYERAIALVDDWVASSGEKIELMRIKGDLLVELGRFDEAIALFQKAVGMTGSSSGMRLRLANAYSRSRDFPRAEAVLTEIGELDPVARSVELAGKGQIYLALGLRDLALAAFGDLEQSGAAEDPRVLVVVGRVLADVGRPDEALERLGRVPAFSKYFGEAQVLTARIEEQRGDIESARRRLEGAVVRLSDAGAARRLLALNLKHMDEKEILDWVALSLRDKRIKQSVRLNWMGIQLSILAGRQDWETSLTTLERIAVMQPGNPKVAAARVALLSYLDRQGQAVEAYKRSMELADSTIGPMAAMLAGTGAAPTAREPVLSRYLRAWAEGRGDDATQLLATLPPSVMLFASDFESAAAMTDDGAPALRLATAWLALESGLGRFSEHLCHEIIEQKPAFAVAWGMLLQAQLKRGDVDDATIAKAIEAVPESSLGMYLSARDRTIAEDWDDAAALLSGLLEREPGNDKIGYELAQKLQRAGKIEEAMQLLERLASKPGRYRLVARSDLAYLLAEHDPDRIDEARAMAAEICEAVPGNAMFQHVLGWIEHLSGNHDAAIRHLTRAAVGLPDVSDVHYHLGVVYQAAGETKWARYHLEAATSGEERPWTEDARRLLGQASVPVSGP